MDAKHGDRPDYALWRKLRVPKRIHGREKEIAALARRALSSPENEVRWAALAWLAGLPVEAREENIVKAAQAALRGDPPSGARLASGLVRWLARAWLGEGQGGKGLEEGRQCLLDLSPEWRSGRAIDFSAVEREGWLPVETTRLRRWVSLALSEMIREQPEAKNASVWLQTAWLLLRDARHATSEAGAAEVAALLDLASLTRREGRPLEAARWAALALQLAPERLPGGLAQRCRAASWLVFEAGLAVPARWGAGLDQMPYPGDPPDSERGREADLELRDPEDLAVTALAYEVDSDPDWQVLRQAMPVLTHPLAALAWVARKAPSHAVKKQHALLEAAVRLALRHGCLTSAGKLLASWPAKPEWLLELARSWQASLRLMPVLRNGQAWADSMSCLRAAWGRLDLESITDHDALFLLHETVAERLMATRLRLPDELQAEDDRQLALALRAEPKLLSLLEHQRVPELWEVAELARRDDLTGVIWLSVALAGEPEAGRCSVLGVSSGGVKARRWRFQRGELAAWWPECQRAIASFIGSASRVVLTLDAALPRTGWNTFLNGAEVWLTPAWEAAFRELRVRPLPEVLQAGLTVLKSAN